jgi:uncharacterized protein YoxC
MRKTLIALTLAQVAILVGALAGYLIAISTTLRRVSQTLGKVTMGVRAIERQTEPIVPVLAQVNTDLAAVADALAAQAEG